MLRELIRKIEKKKIQRLCPHEYYDLNTVRKRNIYESWNEFNMYCPICDSEITVKAEESIRIIEKQKIRKKYELSI